VVHATIYLSVIYCDCQLTSCKHIIPSAIIDISVPSVLKLKLHKKR